MKNLTIAIACAATLLVSTSIFADVVVSDAQVIKLRAQGNGTVYFQLDNHEATESMGCSVNAWYFVDPSTSEYGREVMHRQLLSAKITGQKVTAYFNGCNPQPVLGWVSIE